MPAPGDKSGQWRADTGRPRRHPCPCGPAGIPFVTSLVERRLQPGILPDLARDPQCKVDVFPSTLAGIPAPSTINFADICFDYSITICVGFLALMLKNPHTRRIVYPLSILRYPASTQGDYNLRLVPATQVTLGALLIRLILLFGSTLAGLTGIVCLSRLRYFCRSFIIFTRWPDQPCLRNKPASSMRGGNPGSAVTLVFLDSLLR